MEVLIVTIVTALACSVIGNFLVLKKLSLMGDAISHAVLFGIVLAFFIAGTLSSPLFFVLSILFAVSMAFIVQWIVDRVNVSKESVIGIVFTFFFALAVILIVRFFNNVHLDAHAVLYGAVEFSIFERMVVWGMDIGPKAAWTVGSVLILNLVAVTLFYKELRVSIFDGGFSDSIGISTRKIHYLVMFLTSITVVTAFEAVGAILVVALLVVPGATAYVFTRRLNVMMIFSGLFAILSAILGYFMALWFDVSVAGSVATMSGLIMMLTVLIYRIHLVYRQGKSLQ